MCSVNSVNLENANMLLKKLENMDQIDFFYCVCIWLFVYAYDYDGKAQLHYPGVSWTVDDWVVVSVSTLYGITTAA